MSIYLNEDPDGVELSTTQLYNVLHHPYKLRRFPTWGDTRRYFTMKDGKLWVGIGATAFKSIRSPSSKYLIDWIKSNGMESDEISSELSDLGSYFHVLVGEMATAYANRQPFQVSKTKISNDLRDYMYYKGMRMSNHSKFSSIITKYCLSIYKFFMEWNVEILSVEFPVAIFDLNLATCIDLVIKCSPPDKIGNGTMSKPVDGEKIVAAINLKTRLNSEGSYRDDGIQLAVELAALQQYLPDINATHAAILVPSYTPQSGCGFKLYFYNYYGAEDIRYDVNYYRGMCDPSIEIQRWLNPDKFLDAQYEDGGELTLDFTTYNPDFGEKTRGRSKTATQSIRDFCTGFFTQNHV